MVFLRKCSFSIVLLLWTLVVTSQETSPLQSAFIKSFSMESEARYAEGAEAILAQYNTESYEANLRIGWLYYKAEDYKKSEKYYTIAMDLMPYAVEAKLGATLPKSAMNLWGEVLKLYQDILDIDSKNNIALYNAGQIYYNREDYGQAYVCFNELNNLYPTDYSALLMHGWSALKLGKSREAKVLLSSLLLLYPSDESAKEGLEILK